PREPGFRVVRPRRGGRCGAGALAAVVGFIWRSRYLGLRSGRRRSHPWSPRRMIPTVTLSSLRNARWWQLAVRFVLGGAVTACTGLVAQHWGPVIGALFLSFPAIFPASATLIARHETEKKLNAGIQDRVRGRKGAALDAAGAVFGGCGLVFVGLTAWLTLP